MGMPIFMPLTDLSDRGLVIRHRSVGRGGVLASWPAIERIRIARVAHGAGDRPCLIERGRERDNAPARTAAIGRLHADHAGERRGLANRAAGIGSGRADAQRPPPPTPSRRRSRRAPRGIGALAPPRIDHRAEARGLVGRAHGELVLVELAEHHRAVAPELRCHGGLVRRLESCREFSAGSGPHALVANRSLMPSGMPPSGPPSPLAISSSEASRAMLAGLIRRFQHERIEHARSLNRLKVRIGQFKGRKGFVREAVSSLGRESAMSGQSFINRTAEERRQGLVIGWVSRKFLPLPCRQLHRVEHGAIALSGSAARHGLALTLHRVEVVHVGLIGLFIVAEQAHRISRLEPCRELLDDLRHQKEVILGGRRIGDDLVGDLAVIDHVGTLLHFRSVSPTSSARRRRH